jgi:hypothetical protein
MDDEKPTIEDRQPIQDSDIDSVSDVIADKSLLGDSISDSMMSEHNEPTLFKPTGDN